MHIGLYPEGDGAIAWEVYTAPTDAGADTATDTDTEADTETVVHSQGLASVEPPADNLAPSLAAPLLDIKALQARLPTTRSVAELYKAFEAMGLNYGPGHRGLAEFYSGEGEVLAKVSLPTAVAATQGDYGLHPGLLDSAVQAAMGLTETAAAQPILPFALEHLEILAPCPATVWAWLRLARDSTDLVRKLDVDLCAEAGQVCVRLRGFSVRVLEGELTLPSAAETGTLLLQPLWRDSVPAEGIDPLAVASQQIFLCGFNELQQPLQAQLPEARVHLLSAEIKPAVEPFTQAATTLFTAVQKLLRDKPSAPVLMQLLVANSVPSQSDNPSSHTPLSYTPSFYTALSGLLKTAQQELPQLTVQIIECDPAASTETLREILQANRSSPTDREIRYIDGRRQVMEFEPLVVAKIEAPSPWRTGGVYLLTGGAGGLGLILAKTIAAAVAPVTLILTGRSPLNAGQQQAISRIESCGAGVDYHQVDITDRRAVEQLFTAIRRDYGSLTGILHAAGVLRDDFIINKTLDDFSRVLAPKVKGTVILDEVSRDLPLELFILFSSVSGALGNAGQSDYATANAFMDRYAEYRNSRVNQGQGSGRTLAVNWPLWADGGMGIDAATAELMASTTGMTALDTASGIEALYRSLAAASAQVMVLSGNLRRIRQKLLASQPTPAAATVAEPAADMADAAGEHLYPAVQQALLQQVSQTLKIPLDELDVDTSLDEYGFDSITFTELINRLNQHYQLALAPTILFEYATVEAFAHYLTDEHAAVLSQHLKPDGDQPDGETPTVATSPPAPAPAPARRALGRESLERTRLRPRQRSRCGPVPGPGGRPRRRPALPAPR